MRKSARWRGCFLFCLFSVSLCLNLTSADAQKVMVSPGKEISLELTDAEFLPALKTLFKKAGVSYWMTPKAETIASGVRLTLLRTTGSLPEVIQALLARSGLVDYLTYRLENGNYVFHPGRWNSSSSRKYTFQFREASLGEALLKVLERANADYVLSLQGCVSQKITMRINEASLEEALDALLAAAKGQPRVRRRIEFGVVSISCVSQEERLPINRPVTLRLRDGNLYTAVSGLFSTGFFNYTLDPKLRTVTFAPLIRKDVPFQTVLQGLLTQKDTSWIVRKENGVLSIISKDNRPDEEIAPP